MNATATDTLSSLLHEESRINNLLGEVSRLDMASTRRVLAVVMGKLGISSPPRPRTARGDHTISAVVSRPDLTALLSGQDETLWERCQACVLAHPEGIATDDVAAALGISRQQAYNSLYVTERRQSSIRHDGQTWYPKDNTAVRKVAR